MAYGSMGIIDAINRLIVITKAGGGGGGGSEIVTGPTTDASGTLGNTNTNNVIFASNTTRQYLRITNPKANTHSIWFQLGAAATNAAPSMEILPGGSEVWEGPFVPSDSVNLSGTTGDAYIAKQG